MDRLPVLHVFRHYRPLLSRHSGSVTRLAMLFRRLPLFVSGLFALGLIASGCAAPGPTVAGGENFNDPIEDTNRTIFGINQEIDKAVILPAARAYRWAVIPPMRQSFHDFMQNLNAPVVSGIDERSRNIEALDDIERTSLDFYATIRSLYRQRRAAQIRHEENNLPNPSPLGSLGPTQTLAPHVATPPQLRQLSSTPGSQ